MKIFSNNNKKAGIFGSILLDFWTYTIFVLIVLIFYIFFNFQAGNIKENKITGLDIQNIHSKADITLISYLKTNVQIEISKKKYTVTFADLIRLWYFERDNYKNILLEKTEEFLSNLEQDFSENKQGQEGIHTYKLLINDKKVERNYLNSLEGGNFQSKNYQDIFCATEENRCNFGEALIPVSETRFLHLKIIEIKPKK